MSHHKRVALLVLLDSIIVLGSMYATYLVMYAPSLLGDPMQMFRSGNLLLTAIVLLIYHHACAIAFRLYNKAWEYASVGELLAILQAVTISILLTTVTVQIVANDTYFRVMLIMWMVHLLLIGGSRLSWRMIREQVFQMKVPEHRALIIGAGSAGTMLARQLQLDSDLDIQPVAFVDDDPGKKHLMIHDVSVMGTVADIDRLVKRFELDTIVIAIPSLSGAEMGRIYEECRKADVRIVKMPKVEDVMLGKVSSSHFQDVQVEDLLGRDAIQLDMDSISKKLTGKTIMVTGAGGSIGSEICRQICGFGAKKILLVGHGENSIYQIDMELRNQYKNGLEIVPVIADVQDRERIFEIVAEHRPDVIYHAAAHKHVPLMEYNPKEAVKNNVVGTRNVAEAAAHHQVDSFVLISTDKAVNPTNVMGSTKRIAEMVIQHLASESQKTKFVAVRFGNVLGSRGSVIPLFKKQIAAGGPITVTDPEITRYFMTIPEASRLVIQAGSLAKGGEIFVLDMGEPVKIVDLAKNLIKLSGLTVEEIGIEFTGIRPGEKMFEELLNEKEVHSKAIFPKIFIGKATGHYEAEVARLVDNLNRMSETQVQEYVLELANRKQETDLKEKITSN